MKKVFFAFILIQFLTFCYSIAFAQNDNEYYKQADSLLKLGKFNEAIKWYDKAIAINAGNEKYFRGRGYAYLFLDSLAQGERDYKTALEINPNCARCWMNLGRIEGGKNNFTKAMELVNKGIAIDDKDAELYILRGQLKENMNASPLQDYEKAIAIDPKNTEAYVAKGKYNRNAGTYHIAISDFGKALKLEPKNSQIYFERAEAYVMNNDLQNGLKDITKSIELDSTFSGFYNYRGYVYGNLNETKKALNDFNKAISLNSGDPESYYYRSLTKFRMEDMDGACEDAKKSLSILMEKSGLEGSIPLVKTEIEENCNPAKVSYYYHRGIACYNLGKFEESLMHYSKGLQKFPNNPLILSFKGNTLFALGKYDLAIESYTSANLHKSKIAEFAKENKRWSSGENIDDFVNGTVAANYECLAKAKIFKSIPDLKGALDDINHAIDIGASIKSVKDFPFENAYLVRGLIYLDINDNEKARADFTKAVSLNSSFAIAYVNRAITYVNSANKVRTKIIQSNVSVQDKGNFNVNFTLPVKKDAQINQENLFKALEDCNRAIAIDNKLAYAYYVRANIKMYLDMKDFCYDLTRAKDLGFPGIEALIIENCK